MKDSLKGKKSALREKTHRTHRSSSVVRQLTHRIDIHAFMKTSHPMDHERSCWLLPDGREVAPSLRLDLWEEGSDNHWEITPEESKALGIELMTDECAILRMPGSQRARKGT